MINLNDFCAFAISSSVIKLECSVPENARTFEWQYTMEQDPNSTDWIRITISDPSDFYESDISNDPNE